MPEKLHRCKDKVQAQGKSEDSAWAICQASLNEASTMNGMSYPDDTMGAGSNTIPQNPITFPTSQNPSYTQGQREGGDQCAVCGLQPMMHMGSDHPYIPPMNMPSPMSEHHIPNNGMGLWANQEGGHGSGRRPEHAGAAGANGPILPMQYTEKKVLKEIIDTKLNCKCNKNRK